MQQSDEWCDALVQRVTELSPTVREIELLPPGGAPAWTPGSHLQLRVRIGEREDTRSYSLVGTPRDGLWRIAVKRVTPSRGGSAFMAALQVGDRLAVQGPNNRFELPPGDAPTLLVAGGIGITPLLGMAQALAARQAPLRMLYAARSSDELVYRDELRAALGERLATFVSALGQRIDLAAEIAALPPQAQLLVCGPLALMQSAQRLWAAAGRPAAALRFETFGAGGAQAAQAFRVTLPRHGLTLEVPAGRSLLEVLEDHGIELLSDCRRGECGLCVVDVLQVSGGAIDHRDVFLSAAERQGNRRLCACVSRLCGDGASLVIDSPYRPDAVAA